MTTEPPEQSEPVPERVARAPTAAHAPALGRVVVFGGTGVFGSLVAHLVSEAGVPVVITGRDRLGVMRRAQRLGRQSARVHLDDPLSVHQALEGAAVAVNCIGPFQDQPLIVLEECLAHGVHYLDISDAREHAQRVRAFAEEVTETPSAVLPGLSTVPCLSGLLARAAAARLGAIRHILIALAPGNRNPRGPGTIASLFDSAGSRFAIPCDGGWREVEGWSEPEHLDFGSDFGTRTVRLVDSPDYDLLPGAVGARTVEFKAGLELAPLNWVVGFVARQRSAARRRRMAQFARLLSPPLLPFGTGRGGLLVVVSGTGHDGAPRAVRGRVLATTGPQGPAVVATPAAVAAIRLATGALALRGLVSPFGWCEPEDLFDELRARGARVDLWDDAPTPP